MNKSKETLHDENVAQCVSDFVDDRLSSEDLDFLLSQENEKWETTLKSYAATQQALNSAEPMTDFSQFDLLSRVREGIDGIEPDLLPDETETSPSNIVDLSERKAAFTESNARHLDALSDSENSRKSNVISVKMFAMAASVAFVALLAGQLFLSQGNDFNGEGLPVIAVANLDQTDSILDDPQDIQALSLDVNNDRLQSYLRQHAEQSAMATNQGMISMARVVSFSTEQDEQ